MSTSRTVSRFQPPSDSGSKSARALERRREQRREAEEAPERRRPPARAGVDRAVRVERARRRRGRARGAPARRRRGCATAPAWTTVSGLSRSEVLAPCLLGRAVAAGAKPRFSSERDQADAAGTPSAPSRRSRRRRRCRGRRSRRRRRPIVPERLEARPRRVATPVGDDEDRDVRAHACVVTGSGRSPAPCRELRPRSPRGGGRSAPGSRRRPSPAAATSSPPSRR